MSRRRGFTLLEMLISLALIAMIMAGLFSVMRLQTRMIQVGTEQVEQAQLARGILSTIASDLRKLTPSIHSNATSPQSIWPELYREDLAGAWDLDREQESQNSHNFGLIGESNRIFLSLPQSTDITDETEDRVNPSIDASSWLPDRGAEQFQVVPPYVQVNYHIHDLDDNILGHSSPALLTGGPVKAMGLSRQERSLSLEHREIGTTIASSDPMASQNHVLFQDSQTDELVTLPDHVVAEEVKHLQFRYFDGWQWHTFWTAGQGLPKAIEIEIGLAGQRFDELVASQESDSVPAQTDSSDLAGDYGVESREPTDPARSRLLEELESLDIAVYRLVVGIPRGRSASVPSPKVNPSLGGSY